MKVSRAAAVTLLACQLLAGCGSTGARDAGPGPSPDTIPVGPATWDVTAPGWLLHGTLHVGARTVTLGKDVDAFVLGATGVYWLSRGTLEFTSAEGRTQRAADGRWSNLVVSADRTVLAAVDESHGPTDRYGTHVRQAVVFDTRSGKQIYRTPDQEPDQGADLADLYEETTPLLHGVSNQRLFFDGATIDLADGTTRPVTRSPDATEVYPGMADTLFPDGYHVGVRGEGRRRTLSDSDVYGVGRVSPDRSTIFDTSMWPTAAVAYDARTGRQRAIEAPWSHFSLIGFSGERRFFGIAQKIENEQENVLRAQQVVSCVLPELTCSPVSPVIATGDSEISDYFQVESTGASPY